MYPMRSSLGIVAWAGLILLAGLLGSCSGSTTASNGDPLPDEASLTPDKLAWRYISTGETSKLDSLLKSNPDLVNIYEETYGNTPLHVAALNGNRAIVDVLLENGASPNMENANGEIPAETALQEAHVDLARYLREVAAGSS
jgi:ankyrin repeat protein